MPPPFRSKQEIVIDAPQDVVWAYGADLRNIPSFHPRVDRVELLDGQAFRGPGVSYRCHLRGGKHSCVEKDIEVAPMERIVTVLPDDTFGITRILSDYTVETRLSKVGDSSTRMEIRHYYSTPGVKAKLLHLIAKRKIARDTQATLCGIKAAIEALAPGSGHPR